MRETIAVISLVVKTAQQKYLRGESERLLAHSSRGCSPSWREVKVAGVVGSWLRGTHSQKTALIAGAQSTRPRFYSVRVPDCTVVPSTLTVAPPTSDNPI